MREASGSTMEPLPATAHLLQPVIERAARDPGRPVAAYRDGDRFVDVTAGEFYERVRRLAKGLIASACRTGDRVALMAHTRLEWLLVDYAILAAGGVTVPVYETSSAEQLEWIVSDSEAVVIVVETPEMAELYAGIADDAPRAPSFVIDEGGLDELARRGESVDDAILDRRIARLTTDRLATIVYTSGTTGRPKGCAITHGNLRTNVMQNLDAVRSMLGPDEVSLVFLPLAHTLQKIIALVGVRMGHQAGVRHRRRAPARGVGVGTADDGRRGAAGVREGLQRRAAQGPCRRPRRHLRQVSRSGDPLVRERGSRRPSPDHRSRARRAGAAGVPQAAGRVRRAHALRLQRRRPAR